MKICIYKSILKEKFKQSNCLNESNLKQQYDILKAQSENYSILIIKSYARNGFSDLILNLFLFALHLYIIPPFQFYLFCQDFRSL